MARPPRASHPLALMALFLTATGCAQLHWSSAPPRLPGQNNVVLSDPAASAPSATSTASATDLSEFEPSSPFSTTDRERIAPIQPWVEQVAREHQMDPDLINGVIWVESRFAPRAKSPAGARGLMQLMPATANAMARQMGRPMARVYDPEFNIEAGSLYLLGLLDRYDGDETLALAAYNAGAGNVNKWMREDGELPPRSLEYVENVQRARMRFVVMREDRRPEQERTMIARAPQPSEQKPEVPVPPERSEAPRREPAKAEDDPVNPLAPSPDVYRPEPTPEPPLEDTPYPPVEPSDSDEPDEPDDEIEVDVPRELPSVLD